MSKQTVRIENISIENLKNVKYGYLNFENKRKKYKASILGLYGQNEMCIRDRVLEQMKEYGQGLEYADFKNKQLLKWKEGIGGFVPAWEDLGEILEMCIRDRNMSMDWDGLQLNEETGCFSICFSGGEFKNLYAQVRLCLLYTSTWFVRNASTHKDGSPCRMQMSRKDITATWAEKNLTNTYWDTAEFDNLIPTGNDPVALKAQKVQDIIKQA